MESDHTTTEIGQEVEQESGQETGHGIDEEMLERIERHRPYFNRIARNPEDANDIVQEVHLNFFQKSVQEPDWWSKIEKKDAYVRISGRNVAISLHRITPQNNDSIDAPDPTGSKELSDGGQWVRNLNNHFDRDAVRRKLVKIMEDFSDLEKELLRLSYFEGCKPKHIAELLGLDYRYVQADCNRARAKFFARVKGILKNLPVTS